jgi:hypothetical protein
MTGKARPLRSRRAVHGAAAVDGVAGSHQPPSRFLSRLRPTPVRQKAPTIQSLKNPGRHNADVA